MPEVQQTADIRLMLPGEYPRYKDAIKLAIINTVPAADTEAAVTNILADVMSGAYQVWIIYGDKKMYGILMTRIIPNKDTNQRVLYLSNLYNPVPVPMDAWGPGLRKLEAFAHREKCDIVDSEVINAELGHLLEKHGYRPVSIRYRKEVEQ